MDDFKYCPRIHHGLVISNVTKNNNMSYASCCWIKEQIVGTELDFNHPDLIKFRMVNKQNILPTPRCSKCIVQENAGKHSMRQGYLSTHELPTYEPTLQYLDVNIDYTCNLACVTCGPDLSTTWRNELKIKGGMVRPDIDQFISNKLDNLDLTHLKEIRFWGGEPFLTNTHKTILEFLVKKGISSQVRLMYNTNGTQRINQSVKELIEQFKFARISFSIDDIGPGFEYLRYPASWSKVEENLMWWKNNLPHNSMLSLTVTVSILNVLYLNRLYDWHQQYFNKSCFDDDIEVYPHQAFGPYGLETMPAVMVDQVRKIENYCQPWVQKLELLGTLSSNLDSIKKTLHENDARRNLNLTDIYPEVAELIGYETK